MVKLNSQCTQSLQSNAQIQAENGEASVILASVSKVFTSDWALTVLGPHHRFQTKAVLTLAGPESVDVHIVGSQDPFWGRQMTHFLIEQLNKRGIHHVHVLSFDENLLFRWSVIRDAGQDPQRPPMEEIVNALLTHIHHLNREYPQTREEAAKAGVAMASKVDLQVDEVRFIPRQEFQSSSKQEILISSAELIRQLKQMNVTSNNQVADNLYNYLGGTEKFMAFVKAHLRGGPEQLQFVNGSGDALLLGTDEEGHAIKMYNRSSCDFLLKTLQVLRRDLRVSHLDLQDLLPVAKSDPGSTFENRFDSFESSLVGKTGTVDPAVNFVGLLSTEQGDLLFGLLLSTSGPADWGKARDEERDQLSQWAMERGGVKAFIYSPGPAFVPFMPEPGSVSQSESLD